MEPHMNKFTFSQHLESKKVLLEAGNNIKKFTKEYTITKYCKLPVYENRGDENKVYVSLKPRDTLQICWEYTRDDEDIVKIRYMILENEDKVYPAWATEKMDRWSKNNAQELKNV